METTNRQELLRLISLVKPALSNQDFIPALKHFCFSGGFVSTFNDAQAMQVKLPSKDLNLDLCLPGDMFFKALSGFNADSVSLIPNDSEQSVVVASGRSAKIKLKTLPHTKFPLELPPYVDRNSKWVIPFDADMLEGVRRCLISVGTNPTHPSSMGVTLDALDGRAVLYSTDNATISRFKTKTKITLPGDVPVIMPTFFCEQLIIMAKAFPKAEIDVVVHDGSIVADFYDDGRVVARVFTKLIADMDPIDFEKVISRHCKVETITKRLVEIPKTFDAAFDRALLILGSQVDKVTKVTPTGNGVKLLTTSDDGEATDAIIFDDAKDPADSSEDPFHIDPQLVTRACKSATHLALDRSVMAFADKEGLFLHIVAHCA